MMRAAVGHVQQNLQTTTACCEMDDIVSLLMGSEPSKTPFILCIQTARTIEKQSPLEKRHDGMFFPSLYSILYEGQNSAQYVFLPVHATFFTTTFSDTLKSV